MTESHDLEEDICRLFEEPIIGASYGNSYGEENLQNLLKKYFSLNESEMETMLQVLMKYSQSDDLASSFVSVGVLHALGKKEAVASAYEWARAHDDGKSIVSHFDIGVSLADYFG